MLQPVPKNHIVVIKPDLSVLIYPINFSEVEYIPKQLGKLEVIPPKGLMKNRVIL